MTVSDLVISYDNDPAVYFPARSVTGKVSFMVTDDLPFDCVQIECIGTASTKRTKQTTSSSGFAKNLTYSASDTFFEQVKLLLGNVVRELTEDDTLTRQEKEVLSKAAKRRSLALQPPSKAVIKAGDYSFPFTFFLPLNCPSSFEGSYGHIRYFCKLVVSCNGAACFARKALFTVIGWTDLNECPLAAVAYQTEAHSSMDDKGGKTLARLCLRQQGYAPGEVINVRMEVVNNCNKPVAAIFAQFVQRVNYAAKRNGVDEWNKWEERRVLKQATRKEKITAKKSALLQWQVFAVPSCCPSMFIETKILRVQYEIQLHLFFDGSTPALSLTAPIMVGVIPMQYSFEELQAAHLKPEEGLAQVGPYLPLVERYPLMPLPIYAQSSDPVDIRDPSDLVFMPESILFAPLTVLYSSIGPDDHVQKRLSRRESKKEKVPARSRSTLSRFSFLSSTSNLAVAADGLEENSKKPAEDSMKTKTDESVVASHTGNDSGKESRVKRWGKKKADAETKPSNPKSEVDKSKKEKKYQKKAQQNVCDKATQEPPVENGLMGESASDEDA